MSLIDRNKLKYEKTIIQDSKYEEGDIVYWVSKDDIEKQPTVEAIPVEWIGTWWDKQPPERDSVFFLLRDWERETGIDASQHAEVIKEMRSQKVGKKENETCGHR